MTSCVNKITRTTIQSRVNKYSVDLTFLITPEVNNHSPNETLDKTELKVSSNLQLADPNFDKQSEIDILIGAEIFLKLLCVGQRSLSKDLTLKKTNFRLIVGGKTCSTNFPSTAKCNLSLKLHNKICEFWETENGPTKKLLSNEEKTCKAQYKENTTRVPETGQYIVKLPKKDESNELGKSYNFALKRFYSLEGSFAKNAEFKKKYSLFIKEYLDLGHMSEDDSGSIFDGYFLPHHAVLKESILTTTLRTVFNASAKTSNGKSLNDTFIYILYTFI